MNSVPANFLHSAFWWRWVAANALGEFIGLGAVAALGFLFLRHIGEPANAVQAVALAGAFVLLGAFEGAVVGLAQRQVLRTRLPAVRGWVRATVTGAMAAWAVGMLPSTLMSLSQQQDYAAPVAQPPLVMLLLLAAGLGAVAGPLLAAFQWLSLREVVARKAWLWLPANAAAWTVGMPVIFLGAQANEVTSSPSAIAVAVALSLLLTGAVVGAVHGRVLLSLIDGHASGESPTA
jgi:hypothetical protein